jgi:hypothetical protein
VTSSSLAVFSETRLRLISQRLGHHQVRELREKISGYLDLRANRGKPSFVYPLRWNDGPTTSVEISKEDAAAYIKAYFAFVHPLYPFLDRSDFEARAFAPALANVLQEQPSFSVLYHTILALGCQYVRDWSFDPGKGRVWQLYQVSQRLIPHVLLPPDSLTNLQV